MTDINERVAKLEARVDNLDSKIDDLKLDVKANHQELQEQLKTMSENSTVQHGQLAAKINSLEKTNYGWYMWVLGAAAVISAIGAVINLLK